MAQKGGLSTRRKNPSLSLSIAPVIEPDVEPSSKSPKSNNSARTPDAPAEILPFLFLGGEQHASSLKCLEEVGVTAIFNVAAECERKRFEAQFDYFSLAVTDKLEEDIVKFFPSSFEYIDKIRNSGGKVIVHCSAGKSRSPTIVMAYLIKREQWPLQRAYEYVKSKRRICPNLGFLLVLAEFEKVSIGNKESTTKEDCSKPSPLRILLVEDDESLVDGTVGAISRLGHVCDVARDGEAAVHAAKNVSYDLILMDLSMPGMNGLEATQQIRKMEQQGSIPSGVIIIALKAEDTEREADENTVNLPTGVDDLLNKPLNPEILEAALSRHPSRRNPIRS